MKKLLLSLLVSAMSISSALADTSTLTLKQDDTKSGGDLYQLSSTGTDNIHADDDIVWDFSMTKGNQSYFLGWDTNTTAKGAQFGSAKQYITDLTITSTGFTGKTISKVTINTSGAKNIAATATVKVGETAFQCSDNDSYTLTATASDAVFTGSAEGEVTITITNTSQIAVYVKSITVEYTAASTGTKSPNIAFERGDYYVCIDDIATFESPILKNPNEVEPITYEVSDPSLASVDENGVVTISEDAEVGFFTLSAIYAGNDEYAAKTVTCEINITEEKHYTVTFDFENEDYGMTRMTGDQNQRNPDNTRFGCGWIKCTVNDETVLWQTAAGNKSLRFFQDGELMIETPENTTIEHIYIYHFSADGDPEDVSMDADHEHVVEMVANIAILTGQSDWETDHHKVSKIEVTYSCKAEVHTAVENAFKASTASDFTVNGKVLAEGAGIEIGEEGSINVVLSHTYPHAVIYHKWEPTVTPAAYYDAIEGYSEHTAPLTLTSAGKLSYYAELNGHQTPVQTIDVTASGTTSINEVEPAVGAKKVYDLMGRKVARPANGLYIVNGVKVRL